MLPPIKTGWPVTAKGRQVRMIRTKSARGTLAVDDEVLALAVGFRLTGLSRGNLALFLLAGVLRDFEQYGRQGFGKEIRENPTRQTREDLAVGQGAIDACAHGRDRVG